MKDYALVPSALGDFLAFEVQRRDPIDILPLPLFLPRVLDIDRIQLEVALKTRNN